MKRIYSITVASLAAASLACFAVGTRAQQPGGVAEQAGEKLDEIGRAIRDGFEKAGETVVGGLNKTGETVRDGLVKTRDAVQGMGIYSRVYSRIHWDKTLHNSNILLRAEGGVVTLRGILPNDAAKARAIALAAETVGVTRVISQLTVPQHSEDPGPAPAPARARRLPRTENREDRENRDPEPER
jgi:hypothetical protein